MSLAFASHVLYDFDVRVFWRVGLAEDGFQECQAFFERLVDQEGGIEDLKKQRSIVVDGFEEGGRYAHSS